MAPPGGIASANPDWRVPRAGSRAAERARAGRRRGAGGARAESPQRERRRERWWSFGGSRRGLTAEQLVFAIDVFQNNFWILSCSLQDLSGTKPYHHFFTAATGFPPIDGPPGACNRAKRARCETEYELPAEWVESLTLSCVATRKHHPDAASLELSASPCRAWFIPSQASFPAVHCIQFRGRLQAKGAATAPQGDSVGSARAQERGLGALEQQGFSEEFVCTLEARERFGSAGGDNEWHVVKLSAQLGENMNAWGTGAGESSRWGGGGGGEGYGGSSSVDMQGSGQASHQRTGSSLLPWSLSDLRGGSGSGLWGRSRSVSERG